MQNYSLDELRDYLANNLDLDDTQRNLVFKFWKAHGANIMHIIERPVSNYSQGVTNIDWEIHMTTQSRHQSNIQSKTATILVETQKQPLASNATKDRIMFEVSKQDLNTMIEKIDSVV